MTMPKIDYCLREVFGGPCGRIKGHKGHCATIGAHHYDEKDAMRETEKNWITDLQADLQTGLGILRMEMGQLPKGGIQQHNLGFVEDRLTRSLAMCHKRLHELGVDMFHPTTHPEVWDGPNPEALEARGYSPEVIALSSPDTRSDHDSGLEDSGPSRDVSDPPQDR
jgi:hypothetical protein